MQENGESSSLKHLGERLKAAQARRAGQTRPSGSRRDASGIAVGLRVVVDLVAGVVVGIVIGYWLDRWLGTHPWLLIVFLFLGCAAGLMNVIRTARQLEERAERERQGERSGKDNRPPDRGGDTG